MVVLVALAALVIDGGFAYAKRREAQNAADAGALAGANALCAGNPGLAEPQALDYAINRNGATAAEVTWSTKVVTVTTTIPHQTFLAGIFGSDVVTSNRHCFGWMLFTLQWGGCVASGMGLPTSRWRTRYNR